MKVHLYHEKSKKTGNTSIILHTTIAGTRSKRSLKLYYKTNPQTELEKVDRKEKILIANRIANEEELKILKGQYSIEDQHKPFEDFIKYAKSFIDSHTVVDKKKHYGVIRKLQLFFKKESIACCEITEVVLLRFARSLENELNGESAHNYFSKLKQILSFATKEMYFRQNPAIGIRVRQSSYVQKDILSMEELNILCSHPASNNQVKSAFILACYTGLRWVDIKNLTWGSITKDTIRLKQAKTKVVVTIPLHENAKNILGERQKETIFVFKLPSHTSALKCLRAWVKSANIDKHITFHSGRHSYGTALISNGVDVSIASKLLGHTSLTNTQRYVRISENQKKDAIKKLPTINI